MSGKMANERISSEALRVIRDTLSKHVGPGRVPGLVALVSHDGETHSVSLGDRSYGGGGVRRDAIFRISSMTKPVTAAATMVLVDQGKVNLDDPIDHLLPELSNRRVLKSIDGPLDETVPARRAPYADLVMEMIHRSVVVLAVQRVDVGHNNLKRGAPGDHLPLRRRRAKRKRFVYSKID